MAAALALQQPPQALVGLSHLPEQLPGDLADRLWLPGELAEVAKVGAPTILEGAPRRLTAGMIEEDRASHLRAPSAPSRGVYARSGPRYPARSVASARARRRSDA